MRKLSPVRKTVCSAMRRSGMRKRWPGFLMRIFSGQWQVCAVRDAAYYQTMVMEQQSEKGGVRLIRQDGGIKGMYAYAAEAGLEIREPLYLPGYEAACRCSVQELLGNLLNRGADGTDREAVVYACGNIGRTGRKPVIMARIVRLEELLKAMTVPEGTALNCSFAVIDPLIRGNSRVWRITSEADETKIHVRETEDSEGVLPRRCAYRIPFRQEKHHGDRRSGRGHGHRTPGTGA